MNVKELVESVKVYQHPIPLCFDSIARALVEKSDFDRVVEELAKWNKVEDKTPICFETGDWHGKRSDVVLAKDSCGGLYLSRVYAGTIDGSKYCDFSDLNDFIIDGITEWKHIY